MKPARQTIRPTCRQCDALMISALDPKKKTRIWKCPSCGREEQQDEPAPRVHAPKILNSIEVEVPSVAAEIAEARGETVNDTTRPPTTATTAGPAGDFEREAESRLKALLIEVPAHERALDRMKAEAHALNSYLLAMGRPGVEIPWARVVKAPRQGTVHTCSLCGKEILKQRVRRDQQTRLPICWHQPCVKGEAEC